MASPAPLQHSLAPLTGLSLAIASVALALGTFMQVLDSTIANVSLPTIAGNLGVASDQGTWIITSFAVANGISVPLTGWLMMRFGVVKTFVASVALFTFASFLCGIAWNIETLIAFRVLQGMVSGPMIPGSQALLLMIFPPNKKATALAIWSMTTLTAPICGPILGGYISDNIAWEWIFLINVPIGILCTLVCWHFMRNRETPTFRRKLNLVSFSLLVFWVGSLQIVLDTGKDADWFSSPAIVVLSLCALIGFIAWLIWEIPEVNPVVDLSLFKNKNFLYGTLALCMAYMMFFANNLLMPLWLQTNMGYIATWAGLAAAPSGIVAVCLTPFVAKLAGRYDARALGTASLLLFATSFYMRSQYSPDVDFGNLIIPMFIMGMAMSMFFISMSTISFRDVSQAQMPAASGLSSFARITAGSFAASLVTTVWDRGESVNQTRLIEQMNPEIMAQSVQQAMAQGYSQVQAYAIISRQLTQQAYHISSFDIFKISAFVILAIIPFVWLAKRSMTNGNAHAAGD
jgi:MFS transporter, DHA2 family, multidrug resistance protein